MREIRSYEAPTRIANAPHFIKGLVNLRGVIVPTVDLRLKLACETAEYTDFTVVIVLNVRRRVIGAMVDSVSDVLALGADSIKSAHNSWITPADRENVMSTLLEADEVEVLVLVDNVTDNLSSTPLFVENEWPRLWGRGMRALSGRCLCCAAHGLSCAITVRHHGQARTLLFDTGPDENVFERNVERVGFDMGRVEGIVLSHGHWDHSGAMLRALQMIRLRNGGREVPTYMHPDMYRSRAMKASDGSLRPFEDVPSAQELGQHGAEVVHATLPQLVLDDCFYISGEIPRVTAFETGLPGQHRRTVDGTGWEPDPLIMDERFVAVAVNGKGLVVFTACSHAGVVNVLRHASECFPGLPVYAVMGGFHLSGTNERVIPETVEALRAFRLQVIAAAHCTGWRATGALASAFGDAVVPSSVGKLFRF